MEELILKFWPQLGTFAAIVAFGVTLKSDTKNTRKDIAEHAKASAEAFKGVNVKLDDLNSKVYDHEGRISKLEG